MAATNRGVVFSDVSLRGGLAGYCVAVGIDGEPELRFAWGAFTAPGGSSTRSEVKASAIGLRLLPRGIKRAAVFTDIELLWTEACLRKPGGLAKEVEELAAAADAVGLDYVDFRRVDRKSSIYLFCHGQSRRARRLFLRKLINPNDRGDRMVFDPT